jgi:TRAP-type C4-dicarboxylate transport system permease small subunit
MSDFHALPRASGVCARPLNFVVRRHLMLSTLIVVAIFAIIAISVVATLRIAASDVYTRSQKIAQIALVWVLPIAGAAIVLVVIASDRSHIRRSSPSDTPDMTSYASVYEGPTSDTGHGHGHGDSS